MIVEDINYSIYEIICFSINYRCRSYKTIYFFNSKEYLEKKIDNTVLLAVKYKILYGS